jgi:Cytochrome c
MFSPVMGASVVPTARRLQVDLIKLQCFACHLIQGERFAAPTQPEPELTGIGRRDPGYLVEWIMNPDAMIVDGSGYTDAQGLSVMPDYRERLAVSDLIDLVAYLKNLGG